MNDGGPDGVVICDRERVLQVFDNIVGNAIKFSSPGDTVRLAAVETRMAAPRDREQGRRRQRQPPVRANVGYLYEALRAWLGRVVVLEPW